MEHLLLWLQWICLKALQFTCGPLDHLSQLQTTPHLTADVFLNSGRWLCWYMLCIPTAHCLAEGMCGTCRCGAVGVMLGNVGNSPHIPRTDKYSLPVWPVWAQSDHDSATVVAVFGFGWVQLLLTSISFLKFVNWLCRFLSDFFLLVCFTCEFSRSTICNLMIIRLCCWSTV